MTLSSSNRLFIAAASDAVAKKTQHQLVVVPNLKADLMTAGNQCYQGRNGFDVRSPDTDERRLFFCPIADFDGRFLTPHGRKL